MNNSKNAMPRQPADAPACLCESCTCAYCHEECYGHCSGCDEPVTSCNSCQTGGIKFPAAQQQEPAPETLAAPEQAAPPPAFDYGVLDAQTAARLQNLARRALESKRRYVLDMMEIVYEAHRELCGTIVHQMDNGKYTKKEAVFCTISIVQNLDRLRTRRAAACREDVAICDALNPLPQLRHFVATALPAASLQIKPGGAQAKKEPPKATRPPAGDALKCSDMRLYALICCHRLTFWPPAGIL